jgi:hypothetical protein
MLVLKVSWCGIGGLTWVVGGLGPAQRVVEALPQHREADPHSPGGVHAGGAEVHLGPHPIVTFQHSSTTLYQVSYHIQYIPAFSNVATGYHPSARTSK